MESIRKIPRAEWGSQPIQPTAGSYWLKCNQTIKVILILLAVVVVFAIVGRNTHPRSAWMLWVPLSAFIASCISLMIVGSFALGPYRAERRLGYTTWPSRSETSTPKDRENRR